MKFVPLGRNGITTFGQTQLYRSFGPLGVIGANVMALGAIYIWYRTTIWMSKKFYHHVILQERNYIHENFNTFRGGGNYHFMDTPMSVQESFPLEALAEMGKKKLEVPEFLEESDD